MCTKTHQAPNMQLESSDGICIARPLLYASQRLCARNIRDTRFDDSRNSYHPLALGPNEAVKHRFCVRGDRRVLRFEDAQLNPGEDL